MITNFFLCPPLLRPYLSVAPFLFTFPWRPILAGVFARNRRCSGAAGGGGVGGVVCRRRLSVPTASRQFHLPHFRANRFLDIFPNYAAAVIFPNAAFLRGDWVERAEALPFRFGYKRRLF